MGLLLSNGLLLRAQSGQDFDYFRDNYPQERRQPLPVNRGLWARSAKDLKYFRPKPEKTAGRSSRKKSGKKNPAGLAQFWMQIGLGLLLLLLVGVGFYLYRQQPVNRRISISPLAAELDFAEIEANLVQADLRTLLDRAAAAGQYPLAVRLYYLLVLQQLHAQQLIRWQIHAPNRTYLLQMRSHPGYADFAALTLRFERVRYGAEPVSAADFAQHAAAFETFLHTWAPVAVTTAVEP